MGKFDDKIQWCHDRREVAMEDLEDIEAGIYHHYDIVDGKKINVTQDWVDHLKREIDMCNRLIKAYGELNTKGA
jgi:hypothetical protein